MSPVLGGGPFSCSHIQPFSTFTCQPAMITSGAFKLHRQSLLGLKWVSAGSFLDLEGAANAPHPDGAICIATVQSSAIG